MGVNIVMFVNVNVMMNNLERIYISSVNLDGLLTSLGDLHTSMTEYLDTKSSDSLDKYYRANQTFRNYLDILNTEPAGDEMLIAEKNIYNLSLDYLGIVEDTINAKRGRDVERYSAYYEKAGYEFEVVETFIYSLNNARFRSNNHDYNVLLTSLKYIESVNIVILLVASILDIILMAAFTGNIIRPLRELSDAAKQVSEGDFDVVVEPVGSEDEIGILTGTFAQMLTSIKEYVVRLGESIRNESAMKEKELMMETQVKDAQLKYLQAQINPHFLYNTLESIVWMIEGERYKEAVYMITELSSLFRISLSKGKTIIRIADEIKHAGNYMNIQKIRYKNSFSIKFDIAEDILECCTVKLVLQPLLENAIYYGVEGMDGDGEIEVKGYKRDDDVYLEVIDNGMGMPEEVRESLLSDEGRKHAHGSGVGIINVHKRIQIRFGENYGLEIESEPDEGTVMRIHLPYTLYTPENQENIEKGAKT